MNPMLAHAASDVGDLSLSINSQALGKNQFASSLQDERDELILKSGEENFDDASRTEGEGVVSSEPKLSGWSAGVGILIFCIAIALIVAGRSYVRRRIGKLHN